jgi:hypothetical protein
MDYIVEEKLKNSESRFLLISGIWFGYGVQIFAVAERMCQISGLA